MDRAEELPAGSDDDDTNVERLGQHNEEEWERFQAQLELAEGFWLGFLFSPSSREAHIFRRRTASMLSEQGRSMHVLAPETPEALRDALPWLLSPDREGAGCAWVQALSVDSPGRDEQPWTAAWDDLLLRTNERREALRRHLQGGVVFVAPLPIKLRAREAAPDLWAIRSIIVELSGSALTSSGSFDVFELATTGHVEESAPDPNFWKAEADRREPGTAGRAEALFQASMGFRHEGRWKEELATVFEAAEIYRTLAKEHPETFRPLLAAVLNNLGIILGKLGLWEDALAATSEAVEIRRALVKAQPEAFLPDLAMSLNNLGNRLGDLGQQEDALAATSEAVEIWKALVKAQPEAFLPDLAMSLNNLGKILSDLGQREDALAVTLESVELRRALAKARPDAFLPALARSLNNLGATLSKLGRREGALAVTRAAVEHYRVLARARPNAFLPPLAGSLNNLGVIFSGLGRREDALTSTQEAVNTIWPFFIKLPAAFARQADMHLRNLRKRLQDLGQEPSPELLERLDQVQAHLKK